MTCAFEMVNLQRVDPKRNMARFYTVWMQCDLFGRTSLMRSWGRIGTTGRVQSVSFGESDAALDAHANLLRRKLSKGYEIVAMVSA